MLGRHLIKRWAKSQAVIALSSGEAELYAAVKASCESIGLQSNLNDFDIFTKIEAAIDATAALGVIKRIGLGKMRHIQVQQLWVQQVSRKKVIKYVKVPGTSNPANTMTKHVKASEIEESVDIMNGEFTQGQASCALKV